MMPEPIPHVPTARLTSLRHRLLRDVLLPLLLTWSVGTAMVVSIAYYFAGNAFDRAILDDAYAVSSHVALRDGRPALMISQLEIGNLLFDQREQMYFAVFDADDRLIAGHAGLRAVLSGDRNHLAFNDIFLQGRSLRTVTVIKTEPANFRVVMGQTNNSRVELLKRMTLFALLPQVVLLLLLAWWLHRAIRRDTEPLSSLQRLLAQRDARDLSPLPLQTKTRDVQQLGDAINGLLERVALAVQSQKEFVGNVAHELRTPLAGIRVLAKYGLARKEPELWHQQLLAISQSEERASHMVDQLLALALADEADASMNLRSVALDGLITEAVLRFLPRADALGVDLGVQDLPAKCSVLGHPALIEGVLNNLIDNALRYGVSASSAHKQITISVQPEEGGRLALVVSDNGPGLEMDQSQQLVKRWARGKQEADVSQGAGLGLAIISRYAELMQAQLRFESPKEAGGLNVTLSFKQDQKR